MKQFNTLLLLAILGAVFLCNAQDDPFEIPKPEIPPIGNEVPEIPEIPIRIPTIPIKFPTISPIIINPNIFCFLSPLPARCNPCKYGQPIAGITCGQGEQKCAANGGTCKVNQFDRAYCCPNEHRGCCPSVASPFVPVLSSFCFPTCRTDAQCEVYQKCCGSCPRCVNATLI